MGEQFGWCDLSDGSSTWFKCDWRPDRMLLRSSRYVCADGVARVVGCTKSGLQVQGPNGIVETPSDHFALLATLCLDASSQPLTNADTAALRQLPAFHVLDE